MAKTNSQEILKISQEKQLKSDIPSFKAGDSVSVHIKITENNRTRIQRFEGIVISIFGSGIKHSFTVRKTTDSIGVEKTFFAHSPSITKIEVMKRGKVRRAKLFYLRERTGKAAKVKEA